MKKIRKRVAGVIVVSMLVGSNITTLAVHNSQLNKINQSNKEKIKKISKLEKNSRSLRDEVFFKNNQIHSQQEEIKEYKVDIQDLKKKNEKIKRELSSVKSRPSKPTQPSVQVSRGEVRNNNVRRFEVTAYTAGVESTGKSPDHPEYGLTASGKYVKEGTTIACPPSIPFGTKMKIEGIGYRVCQDRGSDIVSGRLDVYMSSLSAAQSFGRQSLLVQIMN
jgi:3D (Asp-Asp-Asp) domain-containing protein